MSVKESVPKAIKAIRKHLGLSQAVLANCCGVTASYISHIESGKIIPRLELLEKIHETYNISYNYLLTGQGSMIHKNENLESFEGLREALGNEQVDLINEMLDLLKHNQIARLTLLAYFADYRRKTKEVVGTE